MTSQSSIDAAIGIQQVTCQAYMGLEIKSSISFRHVVALCGVQPVRQTIDRN